MAKPRPNLKLNLNASKNEEVELRNQYALNSPTSDMDEPPSHAARAIKQQPKADDTPVTKRLRKNYDVNSPRADLENDDVQFAPQPKPRDGEAAPPPDFMTQVPRDQDANAPPADLITSVPEPQSQSKAPAQQKDSTGGGWCSCFSPAVDIDSEDDQLNDEYEAQHANVAVKQKKTAVVHPAPAQSIQTEETAEDIATEEGGLLGRRRPQHRNQKCLVIDLDETLVHSSFKPVQQCDFIVPVEIDGIVHKVYVLVRPNAVPFLNECAKHYEIVLFTASLSKYADPLLDLLDKGSTIDYRLFREHCVNIGYSYVKDLSKLGRKMNEIMIIDNSPQSYRFHPMNAIPITSWFDNPDDTELFDLLPVLSTTLKNCNDVRDHLDASKSMEWLYRQAETVTANANE